MKILTKIRKCLILVVIWQDNSNELLIGKMKDKTEVVVSERFVWLLPQMY